MEIQKPFNLHKWLDQNRAILKPPVGNKNLYHQADDFIVMVVAGPNARKDYHYNETEELFYQLEGHIKIHIQVDGSKHTLELGPGDMYLHPAKIPHSPERGQDSIGLVIERVRAGKGFTDGLVWYCDQCNEKLHEVYFELQNIEKDFYLISKNFYSSLERRSCSHCGM